ncbi:MAG: cellulase family glycosylhydrolase [Candidatus Nitrosocaldaceae archaeon]
MGTSINISPTAMTTGTHLLAFYAVDRVGNTHPVKQIRIIKQIDFATLPVASYHGINNDDRILTTRKYPHNYPNKQPPHVSFPNQLPVETRFKEIKEMGLNAIRINMFWEAHRWYKSDGKASTFLNKLEEIASTADSLGLGILYNVMHQWKISSVIYSSSAQNYRGAGFPEECLQPLGLVRLPPNDTSYVYDVPITEGGGEASMPRSIFWKNFVKNYNITIDGVTKPIWQHLWDDHFKDVVAITKDHPSTIGYDLLNEPFEGVANVDANDYDGLGRYYAYITSKILELDPKIAKCIFFTSPLSWRLDHRQIESVYPDLKGKSWQYKQAELTKRLLLDKIVATINNSNGRLKVAFAYNIYGWATPSNSPYPTGYIHPNDLTLLDEFNRALVSNNNNDPIPKVITEFNQSTATIAFDPTTEPTTDTYVNGYLAHFKQKGYGWFYFNYDPNYPWTIKDSNYNDRWNSTRTMTFKQMLTHI